MTIKELLQMYCSDINKIAKENGATDVRIPISLAEVEASLETKIDLVVKVEQNIDAWIDTPMIKELEDLLGYQVTITPKRELHHHVRDSVLRTAVPIC